MFPDLRLLISATVATFFLAAIVGLYASLRITQDQFAARNDSRTAIDESPITRISTAWPLPEPGRAAALRDLAKIAKYSPAISDEPASAPDRGDIKAVPEATLPDTPIVAEGGPHASLNDGPAPDVATSNGIAVPSETGSVNQTGHPDIQGNVGDAAALQNAGADKEVRRPAKTTIAAPKKKSVTAQRRKKVVRLPEPPVDPLASGYPLYLTVPVTN